jgi:hypothetical protein
MSTTTDAEQEVQLQKPRRDINLEMKRIYRNREQHETTKPSKSAMDAIDFHLNGRNRFMKINQPTKKLEPELLVENRVWTRFKNPKLSKFETLDHDDYKPKHYVFDSVNESEDKTENKDQDEEKITNMSKHKSISFNNLSNGDKKLVKKNEKKTSKVGVKNGTSMSNIPSADTKADTEPVDEKKVNSAMKQIEDILKDKKKKGSAESDLRIKSDVMTPKEKAQYLKDKNIQVNLATKDSDDAHTLVKKPEKSKAVREDQVSTSTQTPRQVS